MKNKNYRESKLKYQLFKMKNNGKKYVVWSLSADQVEYVKRFFRVDPELYRIRTRLFSKEICDRYPILKYLHNEKRNKKHSYFVTRLKKDEKKILDSFEINYSVIKYKVYLV